jgi:CBS domain-containing protein
MSAGRLCTRSVSIATPEESVRAAAARMREHGVGTLVVLDAQGGVLGILTDRDVVLRVVAEGRDPEATPLGEVMSAPAHCVSESTPIEDALAHMARAATRRLVVTGDDGRLVGLLALDDVLELLAEEAGTIGHLLRRSGGGPSRGSASR